MFLLLIETKDNKLIKDIKDYISTDIKVLYISNDDNYYDYPIEMFKKYDISYLYINSSKLSKFEKTKIEDIINSKYLSNIIVIFDNGKKIDAIIEYEDEQSLNMFLQHNELIPEVIGDNSKILENVNEVLNTDYSLIYLPYNNIQEMNKQDNILRNICEEYEINYKKIDAYLLSKSQKSKLVY